MTKEKKNLIFTVVVIATVVIGAVYLLSFRSNKKVSSENNLSTFVEQTVETGKPVIENEPVNVEPTNNTSLANPASVNCEKQGGKLQIEDRPDGGQYGLCYFEDNRACEEWAMMRGECPVGGVKTTGFDTVAQKFCAWSGGETLAVSNAVCKFKDGSSCLDYDYYIGSCQKGDSLIK